MDMENNISYNSMPQQQSQNPEKISNKVAKKLKKALVARQKQQLEIKVCNFNIIVFIQFPSTQKLNFIHLIWVT